MMDSLTVLSIISHTHKHNNNEANILTVQMFGLHMLKFQPWHYRHESDMGIVATLRAPREANVQTKITSCSPGHGITCSVQTQHQTDSSSPGHGSSSVQTQHQLDSLVLGVGVAGVPGS